MEMQCVYYAVGTEQLRYNLDSFHFSKSSKFRASYEIKSQISLRNPKPAPNSRVHTQPRIAKASFKIILCYINQKQSAIQRSLFPVYLTTRAEYQTNIACNENRDE